MIIRAIIADDEPPARRKLVRLLAAYADVSVLGEASTGGETVALLRSSRPDVVFLDVQMPGMDGFQVLEVLGEADMAVVFVTAFDEYAVRAFEVEATDYLLKPVTEERLARVIDRLRAHMISHGARPAIDAEERRFWKRILVRGPRVAQFVDVQTIDWIEADRNYVVAHCGDKEHLVRTTIESFVAGLDPADFVRINRSTAVNLSRIRELRPWTHGEYRIVLHDGRELSWSRRFLSSSLDRFLP